MAARAGFEPATLRTKGAEFTDETPCPTVLFQTVKIGRQRIGRISVGSLEEVGILLLADSLWDNNQWSHK